MHFKSFNQIRDRSVHDGGGGGLHGGADGAGGAAAEGDVAALGDVPGRRRHQVHPVDPALSIHLSHLQCLTKPECKYFS